MIKNARLAGSAGPPIDIGIANKRIAALQAGLAADAPVYDAKGRLACPGQSHSTFEHCTKR